MAPRRFVGCRVRGEPVHWRCMTPQETLLTVMVPIRGHEHGDEECGRCGRALNDESPDPRAEA